MKRVGVLIDFSYVSEVALQHALLLSANWMKHLYLIHIAEPGKQSEALTKLEKVKDRFIDDDLKCENHVDEGEFFDTIPNTLNALQLDLIVVGTHGIRSMSDPKYGLDIIRLIDSVETPFLIVQDHSQPPESGFDEFLLPVLPSQLVENNAPFLTHFIRSLKARLTVLAVINEETEKEKAKALYKSLFSNIGNQLSFDYELTNDLVGGFGKSILQYASIEDAKVIAVKRKHEQRSLQEDDFRQILLNRQGFAILVLS